MKKTLLLTVFIGDGINAPYSLPLRLVKSQGLSSLAIDRSLMLYKTKQQGRLYNVDRDSLAALIRKKKPTSVVVIQALPGAKKTAQHLFNELGDSLECPVIVMELPERSMNNADFENFLMFSILMLESAKSGIGFTLGLGSLQQILCEAEVTDEAIHSSVTGDQLVYHTLSVSVAGEETDRGD